MNYHLRLARPVRDLARTAALYTGGLGLAVLGSFKDHDGFDGILLGVAGLAWHLEFTCCPAHPIRATPSAEDLVVFYIPDLNEWQRACQRMTDAGFVRRQATNPYWNRNGATFQDPDGYQTILQNAAWVNAPMRLHPALPESS